MLVASADAPGEPGGPEGEGQVGREGEGQVGEGSLRTSLSCCPFRYVFSISQLERIFSNF